LIIFVLAGATWADILGALVRTHAAACSAKRPSCFSIIPVTNGPVNGTLIIV